MRDKKGFTLIELIVVILIIGIMVMIGSGAYKGYTKDAKRAEHMSFVKELESASERYYMKEGRWPKASEEPYTAEEIATYSKNIMDLTGEDITLDPGNYYEIAYNDSAKYTKIPKDRGNYILQNPVGRVYYLEDLTRAGKDREGVEKPIEPDEEGDYEGNEDYEGQEDYEGTEEVKGGKVTAKITIKNDKGYIIKGDPIEWDYSKSRIEKGDTIIDTEWKNKQEVYNEIGEYTVGLRVKSNKYGWSEWVSKKIGVYEDQFLFMGLDPAAFDKNASTVLKLSDSKNITWEGNLDNKLVNFEGRNFTLYIYDSKGTRMSFNVNGVSTPITNYRLGTTTEKVQIMIPAGADRIYLTSGTTYYVNDVYVQDSLESPEEVYNIESIRGNSNISLTWESDDSNIVKYAIYRDGLIIGYSTAKTYKDTPLYSDFKYVYHVQAVNVHGNGSDRVQHTTRTLDAGVNFRVLGPEAFDKDTTTIQKLSDSKNITWEGNLDNKLVNFEGRNFTLYIYDSKGTRMSFNINGQSTPITNYRLGTTTEKVQVMIPSGAARIHLTSGTTYYVNDVYVQDSLGVPTEVHSITSISENSNITLNWQSNDSNTVKYAIYRDGLIIGYSTVKTYKDTPLYSDKEYVYHIQAVNVHGNGSAKVEHTTRTSNAGVNFRVLGPEAFDKDATTIQKLSNSVNITWEGNLDNKLVNFEGRNFTLYIYDSKGTRMSFNINGVSTPITNYKLGTVNEKVQIMIPAGAARIYLTSGTTYYVNDVYLADSLEIPEDVYNITSTIGTSNVTLNWQSNSSNNVKYAIYRDGLIIGYSTGKTYKDTPLYSDFDYEYHVQAINIYGNGSNRVKHSIRTSNAGVNFRVLGPEAFDKDTTTMQKLSNSVNMTWEGNIDNKIIGIEGKNFTVYMYDKSGSKVNFNVEGVSTQITSYKLGTAFTTVKLFVPPGVVRIYMTSGTTYYVNDVYVVE